MRASTRKFRADFPFLRLAFTSDLHIDHHPEVVDLVAARAREAEVDVLVVAGDVSSREPRVADALDRLADEVPRVAFVPGNHDLWVRDGDPDSRERYEETIPALCARAGVVCLTEGPIDVGGVTLVGQTGWYDYSLADPALGIPASDYRRGRFGKLLWTDKQLIRWPGLDDEALTAWMTERLARDLAAAPRDRPAVVVTHMLPFVELATSRPLPWGFVRGFLGATSLGRAIADAVASGLEVAQVISGHTHFARRADLELGGRMVPAETSPIGYPREVARQAPDLVAHVAERVRIVTVAG
jgi:predicted MPP superfamily phosphohydrolase